MCRHGERLNFQLKKAPKNNTILINRAHRESALRKFAIVRQHFEWTAKVHGCRKQQMTEPLAVTIPEAARLCGIGRSTIYSQIKAGNLKVNKIGRRTIVPMQNLKGFLDSTTGEAA